MGNFDTLRRSEQGMKSLIAAIKEKIGTITFDRLGVLRGPNLGLDFTLEKLLEEAYQEGIAAEKAASNRAYVEADMLADKRKMQVILNRPSDATDRDLRAALLLARHYKDPWLMLNTNYDI